MLSDLQHDVVDAQPKQSLSADIRGLFCEYCDRLGVRWTQSNHRNISVSHRRSVAILDGFIGPKS